MADLLERVVVPVANEEDAVATAHAIEASGQDVGAITLVHVVEKAGGAIDKAGVEQRELEAEEAFDAFEAAIGRDVDTDITYGEEVDDDIFAVADEIDATSIVITPRGGSRWIRLLTGDVALSLVTESDRPVVVRPDGEEAVEDE